jgi:hypothetical protein
MCPRCANYELNKGNVSPANLGILVQVLRLELAPAFAAKVPGLHIAIRPGPALLIMRCFLIRAKAASHINPYLGPPATNISA